MDPGPHLDQTENQPNPAHSIQPPISTQNLNHQSPAEIGTEAVWHPNAAEMESAEQRGMVTTKQRLTHDQWTRITNQWSLNQPPASLANCCTSRSCHDHDRALLELPITLGPSAECQTKRRGEWARIQELAALQVQQLACSLTECLSEWCFGTLMHYACNGDTHCSVATNALFVSYLQCCPMPDPMSQQHTDTVADNVAWRPNPHEVALAAERRLICAEQRLTHLDWSSLDQTAGAPTGKGQTQNQSTCWVAAFWIVFCCTAFVLVCRLSLTQLL